MKTLKLLKDNGQAREYQLGDGRCVTIEISDDSIIKIKDSYKNKIGEIELSSIDDELLGNSPSYRLTWMYLDLKDNSYKHQGICREALKFFKEIYGMPITASEHNGIRKADGSHLTGDAPYFVEKMRNEGIIE